MRRYYHYFILVLFVALGACGGGGGGDNPGGGNGNIPQPSVQITQVNGAQVASIAMEADTAAETGSAILPFNAEESETRPETDIVNVSRMIIDILSPSSEIRPLIHEDFCLSGGIEAPHGLNTGTISFNNCEVEGLFFNGSVDFSYSESASTVTFALNFRNFSISADSELLATFNGDLRVESISLPDNFGLRLTGSVFLSESADDIIALYNFTIEVNIDGSLNSTESFTYTVNSNLIGGTVRVTTNPAEGGSPLQYLSGSLYPTSGAVVVIGANNSRVRVTATGSANASMAVMIEFDPDGDGSYNPDLTQYMSWSQFELLSNSSIT